MLHVQAGYASDRGTAVERGVERRDRIDDPADGAGAYTCPRGVTSVSWTVDSLVVVTSDVVSVPPSAEQCREAGVDIWTAGAV